LEEAEASFRVVAVAQATRSAKLGVQGINNPLGISAKLH